ncbi:MAG: prepilin-type N-terminal cleavage/methylation domain-containing protein [Chloroflexi bacterium]|nr:prepilin-type N-terminal cleavage/methylation domain-containing protein [Chloroflexota bacterium]
MKKFQREEGFTLVEILIVLIILALLVAIVIPAVAGFLSRGRTESFNGDQRNIQASVDSYYTDKNLRASIGTNFYNAFPTDYTADGVAGLVTSPNIYVVVSTTAIVNKNYMRSVPASGSPPNSTSTATGHYTWVIESNTGKVYGCPAGTGTAAAGQWTPTGSVSTSCVFDGNYP